MASRVACRRRLEVGNAGVGESPDHRGTRYLTKSSTVVGGA